MNVDRGFVISLLVFNCILFGGGFLFRHSEAGTQASTAAAFLIGIGLLTWFSERERGMGRRKR